MWPRPWPALLGVVALALPVAAAGESDSSPLIDITVGVDPAYPPYEYEEGGQAVGFNVDLTNAIGKTMNMKVHFKLGKWSELRAALESGTGGIDALQGISWSQDREKTLDFAPPHMPVSQAIFARMDSPAVSSLDDLRGWKVLVFRGGIMEETLTKRGQGGDLVRVDTAATALRSLASGEGDFAVVAEEPGVRLTERLHLEDKVRAAVRGVIWVSYGYAVRKGNDELLRRLTDGLEKVKTDGRYEAIKNRWLTPWREALGYGGGGLSLALVGWAGHSWRKRRLKRRSEKEALAVRQQLSQADRMAGLGLLVSQAAHDISGPNAVIRINAQTLKLALEGPATFQRMREKLLPLVEDTLKASERIKGAMEDVREGRPPLAPTDLNQVVQAAVHSIDTFIRQHTQCFTFDPAPHVPPVLGDTHAIDRVVANLVINACEALPDRSHAVRVETRHLPQKSAVAIRVVDEGNGISADDLQRLTHPHYTTKSLVGEPGRGLGLSAVQRIVDEHRGSLDIQPNSSGVGITATVTLPVASQP